ncbi:MAG: exsH [Frankiales bacterium]|nr:exsH [Frankiales bacterium]
MQHVHPRTRRLFGAATSLALGASALLHLPHLHSHKAPQAEPASTPTPAMAVAVGAESVRLASPVPRHLQRAARSAIRRAATGAMPTGNVPGWQQFLAQDFTGNGLPKGWDSYAGRPGGNPNGWWTHAHASVRGKDLHLVGDWQRGTFTTGGVMASDFASTYGKYEVRFKLSKAPGVAYALLLWPANGSWPSAGEIDFAEDGGGDRATTTSTLHYGAANTQVQRTVRADFTQYQTVGVEWTPGKLVYTLNGKRWATVTGAEVPTGPMRLAMQLEAGKGTRWSPAPSKATPSTVDMVVDWVVGYRRAA